MKKIIFTLIFINVISVMNGQNVKPCSSVENSQFDFWVGDWDLTYSDTMHATNKIERAFDGCVVHEKFYDPNQDFRGESWSMYNPVTKLWQQTWVDNQGSYFALTGKFENNEMLLFTAPQTLKKGGVGYNKMRFYNISPDSFDWNWELTRDEGKTWNVVWSIRYTRKK
ncbi:MAG: hypothetical protein ACO1G6_12930 [Bacteroidota bacterium]